MSNVVEFPCAEVPAKNNSDFDEDEIYAEREFKVDERRTNAEETSKHAFRDLEGHICDCVCMGNIASQLMANARCDDETLSFAVFHLSEMLLNLNKHYKAAWRGERPAYRLIRSPAKTTQEIKETCASLPTEDES
jgi:hypothetical protein